MIKLFLSPSTQEHNPYKGGGNEETEMRDVVSHAVPYLKAAGYDVKVGGTVSASANVTMGNSWGADYYIAVHSNAGGGDGTVTFYHSNSPKGKDLAGHIHAAIAPLSPGKDDGVKANDGLIEIHGPKAPAVLTEVAFHDNVTEAAWIKANEPLIGKALAKGILDYFGKPLPDLTPKPTPVPTPTPTPTPAPVLTRTGVVTARAGLRVRKGAGVKYGVIGTLAYKTKVTVIGKSINGWYKIKYKTGYGYVSKLYINIV